MKLWMKSLLMTGAIVLLTVAAAAAYLFTVSNSTVNALKSTYTNVGNKNTTEVLKATKPLTIVLLGVDTGGAGRGTADSWNGNSDSQIVMTLNPKTNTTTMVSMERDTMTNIMDASGKIVSKQKMNAAYPMGFNAGDASGKGLETAVGYSMKTIGSQAGIPIDNFFTINFDGIINLVNAVGGIDVYNDPKNIVSYEKPAIHPGDIYISDTEPEYTAVVKPGNQHLNGEQALVYSRDRHHRADGDYGRQAAQREVISQLMKKLLALDNVTQYQKLLNEAAKDFKTNIPITNSTLSYLLGYKDCFKKIVSIQSIGNGQMVNGGSYEFFSENTYLAFQNAMRLSLGESAETSLNPDLVTLESYFGSTSDYFLPSATVTEKGKQTIYGVATDGQLVTLNAQNSGKYVSAVTGEGLTAAETSSNSSTSASSSSSNAAAQTNQSSTSELPDGLTATTTQGVYTSRKGYTVYYKNGNYVYENGTLYPDGTKYPGQ